MRETGITCSPIGIVHSEFTAREGTPIQPAFAKDAPGQVVVYDEFAAGLQDLDGFSHLILLYHFHLSGGWRPLVRPFMEEVERGVFATRAPNRPNPIGLSVVRLEKREESVLHVRGIDVVDGTPLLDIKPYVPAFDALGEYRFGWIENALGGGARRVADDRFISQKCTEATMTVPERARALMGHGKTMALATATSQGDPNVAPMQQCWWYDENTLVIGDFFMKATKANILSNPQVSFTVWQESPREGYKFKGSARYVTSGAEYDFANNKMKEKTPERNFKGVVAIRVNEVYDIKSGPTAGQLISGEN